MKKINKNSEFDKPDVIDSLIDETNRDGCKHKYKCTLDTDYWSHYVCKKCGHSYILDFDN